MLEVDQMVQIIDIYLTFSHPVTDGSLQLVCDDVIGAAVQTASSSSRCRCVRVSVRVCVCVPVVCVCVRAEQQQLSLCSVGSLQQRLDEHLNTNTLRQR